MNETGQTQLLYVASIDQGPTPFDPDEDDESLSAHAVLAGPGGWAGLLQAARLRDSDDQTCYGYVLKAWATDLETGALIGYKSWSDLCSEQVHRIYEAL